MTLLGVRVATQQLGGDFYWQHWTLMKYANFGWILIQVFI